MSKQIEALKLALDWYDSGNENPDDFANMIKQVIALAQQPAQGCDYCNHPQYVGTKCKNCGREQPAQDQGQSCYCPNCEALSKELAALKAQQQEPVTILPDGSAFAVVSYPLPKEHWLYAERQYEEGAEEPIELGKPILTHALRDAVVAAVRYAIRGATNCGKESDFDPDALVQNAVYALCGPFTSPQPASKSWVDWIDPNDKTQKQYLPHIGEPVLFCHKGKTYCGHHNGGLFQNQEKYFDTWECRWMPLPAAHGITGVRHD